MRKRADWVETGWQFGWARHKTAVGITKKWESAEMTEQQTEKKGKLEKV